MARPGAHGDLFENGVKRRNESSKRIWRSIGEKRQKPLRAWLALLISCRLSASGGAAPVEILVCDLSRSG